MARRKYKIRWLRRAGAARFRRQRGRLLRAAKDVAAARHNLPLSNREPKERRFALRRRLQAGKHVLAIKPVHTTGTAGIADDARLRQSRGVGSSWMRRMFRASFRASGGPSRRRSAEKSRLAYVPVPHGFFTFPFFGVANNIRFDRKQEPMTAQVRHGVAFRCARWWSIFVTHPPPRKGEL
jgi:hypothetical protein